MSRTANGRPGRRGLALGLGGLACVAGLAIGQPAPEFAIRSHAFAGIEPAPRRADGRFENPDGPIEHAGPSVTLPFFVRRVAARFRSRSGLPDSVAVDLEPLESPDAARVTWLGHATLLVRMNGVAFLTDPNWSQTAGPTSFAGAVRLVDPPVPIADLPRIDFAVLSHNHYDHLDLPTLRELARLQPQITLFVPLGLEPLLREIGAARIVELDWGQTVEISDVRVHCLPARHWSRRGLFDTQRSLWSSWAVTSADRRFYFGGDSAAFAGFDAIGRALGPFDLVALPIGAYEPVPMMKDSHLNPEEAADASVALRARCTLGVHYGTFDLSDEPHDEPPRRFRAAMKLRGVEADRAWVLAIGESRSF